MRNRLKIDVNENHIQTIEWKEKNEERSEYDVIIISSDDYCTNNDDCDYDDDDILNIDIFDNFWRWIYYVFNITKLFNFNN